LFLPLVSQANKNTINAELANPSDTK